MMHAWKAGRTGAAQSQHQQWVIRWLGLVGAGTGSSAMCTYIFVEQQHFYGSAACSGRGKMWLMSQQQCDDDVAIAHVILGQLLWQSLLEPLVPTLWLKHHANCADWNDSCHVDLILY